jgi:hypothetical protein
MKNAEIKSQIAELKDASRLHKRVINEIVEDSKDYDGDFTERLTARLDDIGHGLSTGIVGSLIYYEDTCAFFKRYQDEIGELLAETIRDTGLQPAELFGDDWDEEDPLCREQLNQNLLAWFAYEAIASQLRDLIEA